MKEGGKVAVNESEVLEISIYFNCSILQIISKISQIVLKKDRAPSSFEGPK